MMRIQSRGEVSSSDRTPPLPNLPFLPLLPTATFATSVKASCTPLFIFAEHSKYLVALILFATLTPSSYISPFLPPASLKSHFQRYQHYLDPWAVGVDLRQPARFDVFQGGWIADVKAENDDVRIGIAEAAELVEFSCPLCPRGQLDGW